jgi:L-malate glycosyltransferase
MDDTYLDSLKNNIEKDGIKDRVIFTGFTTEVQKLMQVCNVIVLATDRETFGLVLIEAMQCEIAVLGSDSAGPLEIIDDNESGLLFKTKDSSDLAKKIEILFNDKSLSESLAGTGKAKADEKFYSEIQFEKLYKIINGINNES